MKTPPLMTPDDPRITETVKARFWAKVDMREPNECWPWMGGKMRHGYGEIWICHGIKHFKATHLSLLLARLSRPSLSLCACHHCHNPECVNPRHLYWGTRAQNTRDMVVARRCRWKLSAEEVEQIREAAAKGETHRSIARRYNVVHSTVSSIVSGRDWGDGTFVPPGTPKGEAHPRARLSAAAVQEIRRAWSSGQERQVDLANRFGIKQVTVSAIVRGRLWKHLLTAPDAIQSAISETSETTIS